MRKQQHGFSLIELLIVVAIILIIAAIAIPNMLRARIAANEASAVSSLRTVTHAQITYASTYPTIGYSDSLSKLATPNAGCPLPVDTKACLIDSSLGSGVKSGYTFSLTATGSGIIGAYDTSADPLAPGSTGQRHFHNDETGVIRYNPSGPASRTDTPIHY